MSYGFLPGARAASLGVAVALAFGLGAVHVRGQVPSRNVNMVSGTTLPAGDPFLQRQNEPSVAASTRNPLHLLGGANDYRTVDLPGLPNGEETGDAWLGLFTSIDGGQRWTSTLVPGYPQDPDRAQSPLRHYAAAADPVVRAGTNGLIYYAGLAFNRNANGASGIFVARFIDNNNVEAGDPFAYLGTSMVATDDGATDRSLDKPWLAVDIPRGKAATCRIETQHRRPNPIPGAPPVLETIVQNVPAGPAYVAYSVFTGDGATLRSSIMFSYSTDCGVSWSAPTQVSAGDDSINQGATIAIDPSTGGVYVGWRRFTRPGSTSTDAMMIAQSVNFGRKFLASRVARTMPRGNSWGLILEKVMEHRKGKKPVEVEALSQYDQPTTPSASSPSTLTFRTNSYPTLAFDDSSRLYMAWSERGFSTVRPSAEDGDAKIVMSTSTDGTTWTAPLAVAEPGVLGHQIMPSLAFAGGKLMLVYYDLRENLVQLSSRFVVDVVQAFIQPRHTMDIRASMATPGSVPVFAPSVRVSDYLIGVRTGAPGARTFPCGVLGEKQCEQLQYNRPNLPMFRLGTTPFMGDYIDIAPAPAFVPVRALNRNQGRGDSPTAGAGWAYNTSPDSHPVFHAVWTDNRDVRPPADGDWTNYTPPAPFAGGQSVFDPSQTVQACTGDNSGSRNQNVYTARITGGLLAGSPGNTKPLSPTLQRGFVVFAQNTTAARKTFRLRIAAQPAGGRASFQQLGDTDTTLDVVTPARSTASRTVFVTSTDPHALIQVEVFEIAEVGAPDPAEGGLKAVVTLNADIENPDIENADIENADIENADIENAEVTNADIENPTIRVADIENADIENPDIENADIENADIENADIENADIENADIENADIENASLTDVTWTVTNTGNTTTAFNVNLFLAQQNVPGVKVQLVLHKSYLTPAVAGCEVKTRSQTVLVANITNPVFVTPDSGIPDANSPDATNGTIWLAPGEVGKITLRLRDSDLTNNVAVVNDKGETVFIDPAFVPGVTVSPVVVPQEIGTIPLAQGETEPPIITTDESTIFFLQQPGSALVGAPIGPVSVQVRGKTGAPQPGAIVTLSLGAGPSGAVMSGVTTAVADVNGVAGFSGLRFSLPGTGYRLRADAAAGPLVFAPALSAPFTILPIAVVNANDSGPGSLREAILNANANTGVIDAIGFAIAGVRPYTIALLSPLPALTDPVVIDAGITGTAGACAPTIEINGSQIEQPGPGLLVTGGSSTIRGLSITQFRGSGIELRQGGGSHIQCTYVGVAPDGSTPRGNAGNGIQVIDSAANTFSGNLVSANGGEGIRVDGASGSTVIEANYVGTDAAGEVDLGNAASGIYIRRVPGTRITGNIVSGNDGFAGIAVCGNLVFCGGGDLGTQGSNAEGTVITGNTVGLNGAATQPVPNAGFGISIDSTSATVVGGIAAQNGNTLAWNATGIRVFGPTPLTTQILQNAIHDNAGLGIDLGAAGMTPNDTADVDGIRNFPVLTSATLAGSTTRVQGTLSSEPNTEFLIQLFSSPSCDPSGHGEGATWFGSVSDVFTDAEGGLTFSADFGFMLPAGTVVTATATGPDGGTSEFSACRSVAPEVVRESYSIGPVGGEGGTPFSFTCNSGSSATALRGRTGDDIDRTELWCSPPEGPAVLAGAVGGNGGVDYGAALTCPAGSVMTGLHGRAGIVSFGGNIVDTLGVTCVDPATGAAFISEARGVPSTSTEPFSLACNKGTRMIGIFGGQGALLDRIGIICQ